MKEKWFRALTVLDQRMTNDTRQPNQNKRHQTSPDATLAAKLGNAVNVVVETIKETTEMRRKMHADQPEE